MAPDTAPNGDRIPTTAAFEPGTVPRDVEIDVLSVVVCSWCGDVAKVDTEGAAYELSEAHAKAHADA